MYHVREIVLGSMQHIRGPLSRNYVIQNVSLCCDLPCVLLRSPLNLAPATRTVNVMNGLSRKWAR